MTVILSDEFNDQVKRTVQEYLRRERGNIPRPTNKYPIDMPWMWALPTADIAAATNAATSAATGEVEILLRDSVSGNLERTGHMETLTNRWEGIALDKDMLLIVALFEGEWIPMDADCSAMAVPLGPAA